MTGHFFSKKRDLNSLKYLCLILLCICTCLSCKKENADPAYEWKGSGVDQFDATFAGVAKPMRVFYYSPSGINENTPILFVFHGVERNAMEYRNALESIAGIKSFIVVAPEFSEENFPGQSAYQIGNIFQDGDQPSPQTLLPQNKWSVGLIEPMLDMARKKSGASNGACYLIGHSAGAQFLHRLILFKPDFPFARAVVSAAGWYTLPDTSVAFPYGLGASPFPLQALSSAFSRKVFVQVGNQDNNPNASNLRRNAEADKQGTHRLARAQYFFNQAENIAGTQSMPFNWELKIISGLNHNYIPALQSGVELIFP